MPRFVHRAACRDNRPSTHGYACPDFRAGKWAVPAIYANPSDGSNIYPNFCPYVHTGSGTVPAAKADTYFDPCPSRHTKSYPCPITYTDSRSWRYVKTRSFRYIEI